MFSFDTMQGKSLNQEASFAHGNFSINVQISDLLKCVSELGIADLDVHNLSSHAISAAI